METELAFVPSPGRGHLVSTVELANRLLHQDQRLSITIFLIKYPFAGGKNAYMESLATRYSRIRFIDVPQVDPPEMDLFHKSVENYIAVYIERHKTHVKNAIISQILSQSKSLAGVVVDFFATSMIDVATELGVASYVFFTSTAAFLGLMLYLPAHYEQNRRAFELSDSDSIIPTFAHPVPAKVLPSVVLNKEGGYLSFLEHAARFRETRGIIINTFAELEKHAINSLRSDGGLPAIYTPGPLLDLEGLKSNSGTETDKIMEWLEEQPISSVLFLCFGSLGSFEMSQLEQIATALEQSGHRFLWSVRQPTSRAKMEVPRGVEDFNEILPEGFLERTKNRGMVCSWAPQVQVLGHKAIGGFISHCGWNSTLESIWHGVPIATWPLYAEQQINAFEMVKELELAVELRLDYRSQGAEIVMADEIEKGIRCLIDEQNPLRKKVKEMGEKSRMALMEGGSSYISLSNLIEDIMKNKP